MSRRMVNLEITDKIDRQPFWRFWWEASHLRWEVWNRAGIVRNLLQEERF